MNEPEAPQNVRVETPDGRTIPCELIYEGVVDGAHRWAAVTSLPIEQVASVRADTIPAKTAVVIRAAQ